jgi:hypothetical protein
MCKITRSLSFHIERTKDVKSGKYFFGLFLCAHHDDALFPSIRVSNSLANGKEGQRACLDSGNDLFSFIHLAQLRVDFVSKKGRFLNKNL